jgi:hypothetical protein
MNSGNSNNTGQQQLNPLNVNSSTIPNTAGQVNPADAEALRLYYEEVLRSNPNNTQAVYYLAIWYLERQSYQQVSSLYSVLILSLSFLFLGKTFLFSSCFIKT